MTLFKDSNAAATFWTSGSSELASNMPYGPVGPASFRFQDRLSHAVMSCPNAVVTASGATKNSRARINRSSGVGGLFRSDRVRGSSWRSFSALR
jgi:hypothetical protein